jgi:hypothetical protein
MTPFEVSMGGLMTASLSALVVTVIRVRAAFTAVDEEPGFEEPSES